MVLTKVTIATNNTESMVSFYQQLFEVEFSSFQAMGVTLFQGMLGSVTLLFCPNELLNIKAEKNNIQLSIVVPSLNSVLERLEELGGKQLQEVSVQGSYHITGITDPDGNSLEILELQS